MTFCLKFDFKLPKRAIVVCCLTKLYHISAFNFRKLFAWFNQSKLKFILCNFSNRRLLLLLSNVIKKLKNWCFPSFFVAIRMTNSSMLVWMELHDVFYLRQFEAENFFCYNFSYLFQVGSSSCGCVFAAAGGDVLMMSISLSRLPCKIDYCVFFPLSCSYISVCRFISAIKKVEMRCMNEFRWFHFHGCSIDGLIRIISLCLQRPFGILLSSCCARWLEWRDLMLTLAVHFFRAASSRWSIH